MPDLSPRALVFSEMLACTVQLVVTSTPMAARESDLEFEIVALTLSLKELVITVANT